MNLNINWTFTAVFLSVCCMAASLYADEGEVFDCYADFHADFDSAGESKASLENAAISSAGHSYSIALDLSKKQIGYHDSLGGKEIWLDVRVETEGRKWLIISPAIEIHEVGEFYESALAVATIYFDQNSHAFSLIWRHFSDKSEANMFLAIESGQCEKRNQN